MGIPNKYSHKEDFELITNYDLVASAHALLGGIELDPASSTVANGYVEAERYFTPSDDGLNEQDWSGNVYLFPPSGTYFFDRKKDRWKYTRGSAAKLKSSHAVWFNKLLKAWLKREIRQGLYFSNCPDMIRHDQRIFDFPMCILKTAPKLTKRTSQGITEQPTCTSFLVFLPPTDGLEPSLELFVSIYGEKGRLLI